jgi:hypothetical protein
MKADNRITDKSEIEKIITWLGSLEPIDYGRALGPTAEQLGVRIKDLEAAVAKKRAVDRQLLEQQEEQKKCEERARNMLTVRDFNKIYAYVIVGGKGVILHERVDRKGRPTFRFISVEAFHGYYVQDVISVDGSTMSISKLWFHDSERRRFEDIVFAPNQETPKVYNLFRGWPYQPKQGGSCDKFLAHVYDNICHGSIEHFKWIMAWFADHR